MVRLQRSRSSTLTAFHINFVMLDVICPGELQTGGSRLTLTVVNSVILNSHPSTSTQ